jgi:hypothetical protein
MDGDVAALKENGGTDFSILQAARTVPRNF